MDEIKGKYAIDQLKLYAKKITDYTGSSASINIEMWCHKYGDGIDFNLRICGWSSASSEFIFKIQDLEDLREIGKAIDAYINKGEIQTIKKERMVKK